MKKIINIIVAVILAGALIAPAGTAQAGNKDRTGEAGASELLINPWAKSSGWAGSNVARVRGLEAQFLNVAGLAFTKSTELVFSHTNWLQGSGINIDAFGFSQKLGENGGVLGFGVVSMNMGEIDITTVDLPEGGSGTFNPNFTNINLSYAKAFSSSIYGGINMKIITEKISDVSANGIAIDAGIQYVTGKRKQIMFGVALKNVGPNLSFAGDGLSFRGFVPGNPNTLTVEQRSKRFELPTLIEIGAAYDIKINKRDELSLAGAFVSNSFSKDNFNFGAQYNWKNMFFLRAGYSYEQDIMENYNTGRTTALTGPTGGFSIQAPLNKEKKSTFSIDYSYRASNPFSGVHSIGARINL